MGPGGKELGNEMLRKHGVGTGEMSLGGGGAFILAALCGCHTFHVRLFVGWRSLGGVEESGLWVGQWESGKRVLERGVSWCCALDLFNGGWTRAWEV